MWPVLVELFEEKDLEKMGVKIAGAWENLLYRMDTARGDLILSYFNLFILRAIFATIFFHNCI